MTTLFNQPLNVINVGIAMFSDDLKKQHVPVTQLDWTPPGQGNMQVVDALDRLAEKPLAEKIAAANKIALERIIQSHPVLVGYDQAINVVPGMTRTTILHAGPPVTWENMCGAMKGAVTGALVFEGLAKDLAMRQGSPPPEILRSRLATSMTAWARWRASPPRRCLCTSLRTKPTATAPSPTSASRWRRSCAWGLTTRA
jgi:hypothetical protein